MLTQGTSHFLHSSDAFVLLETKAWGVFPFHIKHVVKHLKPAPVFSRQITTVPLVSVSSKDLVVFVINKSADNHKTALGCSHIQRIGDGRPVPAINFMAVLK